MSKRILRDCEESSSGRGNSVADASRLVEGTKQRTEGERTWVRYYGSVRTVSTTQQQPHSATDGDGQGATRREEERFIHAWV